MPEPPSPHSPTPNPAASGENTSTDKSLRDSVLLAALTTGLYFIAAYAALRIQTGVANIAIFWPASGIAVGLMIALGPKSYRPVAAGTILATIAANLAVDRSLILTLVFSLLNSFDAFAVAWLLTHLPKRYEIFPRLISVFTFFAGAALSTAMTASVAASLSSALPPAPVDWFHVWRVWFFSDFVGIVTLAPLVIAVTALVKVPPRNYDWSKDAALLLLLAAVTWNASTLSVRSGSWLTLAPGTTVVPVLIWLATRGQPVVPALGIVIVAGIMAMAAATGQGRFGDPSIAVEARQQAAQASLTAIALVTLLVSALFQERRSAEARIAASERLVATTADIVPGVIFSLKQPADGPLRFTFVSAKSRDLLDLEPAQLLTSAEPLISRLAPDCRAAVLRALDQPDGQQEPIRLELAIPRPRRQTVWLEMSAAPAKDADGTTVWHGFLQNVTARRVLLAEIDHRTRNLITVVQSVAHHTARFSGPEEFADVLDERLIGLARSHGLLVSSDWRGIDIDRLARTQLAHLASLLDTRIHLAGSALLLKAAAAQVLGMAIHELGTNALKYGALSTGAGEVDLSWEIVEGAEGEDFLIRWQERDGPTVTSSGRKGFGHTVTLNMVAYQLQAHVTIDELPEGIVWRAQAPASQVIYTTS